VRKFGVTPRPEGEEIGQKTSMEIANPAGVIKASVAMKEKRRIRVPRL